MGPREYRTDGTMVTTISGPSQGIIADAKAPFALRPLGQGMVVAIPDSDPTNNPNFRWDLLFNNVGVDHWHWSTRHGVEFNNENDNYWNF